MNGVVSCPECGFEYPHGPKALCPRCLLGSFAAAPAEPERQFGDYLIESEPKAGGMGVVYRARHVSLNRTVALKLIKAGQLATREDIQRFQTEAEAAANLDHPHIVSIFEIGEHEGRHFFTMRYLEGGSLADALRQRSCGVPPRPQPVSRSAARRLQHEIADLMETIADAVDHAHQRGVLHRDLKPDNVLLDHLRRPHLTDFGLAKLLAHDYGHTQTRALLGSPCYMSPEQVAGNQRRVTTATDIYSLGAILYELLVGHPPHHAETIPEILRRVAEDEPVRPRHLQPLVDPDLETICLKCLSKEPALRYPTAAALAEDLRSWREGRPIAARPPGTWRRLRSWTSRHPALAGLVVVGTLAVILASALVWQRQFTRLTSDRARFASLQSTNSSHLLRLQNAENQPGQGSPERQLVALAQVLRETPTNATRAEFPAGWVAAQRVLSVLGSRNYLVPSWEPVIHLTDVNSATLSPNGAYLATAPVDFAARLWNNLNGRLLRSDFQHEAPVQGVRFSPDSSRLLTWSEDRTARLWNLAQAGVVLTLHGHAAAVTDAAFSPDGTLVLTRGQDRTVRTWETSDGTESARVPAPTDLVAAGFFRHGTAAFSAASDGSVHFWDARTGVDLESPLMLDGSISLAAISPDDRAIAAIVGTRIRVVPIAGSRASSLTLDVDASFTLETLGWAPGGRYLAAGGGQLLNGTASAAFVWDTVTGRLVSGPLRHPEAVGCLGFSPNGLTLATGSYDGTVRLWEVPSGRELSFPLVHGTYISSVEFSANGSQLATSAGDYCAAVWPQTLGRPTPMLIKRNGTVGTLDFQPGSDLLLTAGDDSMVRLIELSTGATVGRPLAHPARVYTAFFTARSNVVFTSASDGRLRLWDIHTAQILDEADAARQRLHALQLGPDRATLITRDAGSGRDLTVWSLFPELKAQPALPHGSFVPEAHLRPGGDYVASASFDGFLRIWNLRTRRPVSFDVSAEERPVSQIPSASLEFANRLRRTTLTNPWPEDAQAGFVLTNLAKHRGQMLASWLLSYAGEATSGDSIPESEIRSNALALTSSYIKRGTAPWLLGCRWSPDGSYLVSAALGGAASVWSVDPKDPANHTVVGTLPHRSQILASAFSPDSQRFLTGCQDGTARLWELPSGRPPFEPLKHDGAVTQVGWSPDGLRFYTIESGQIVRLWDTGTGLPLSDPLPHPASITAIRFTPDGNRLLTASTDAFLRVWDALAPDNLPPRWMASMVDALAHTSTRGQTERHLLPTDLYRIKAQRLTRASTDFYTAWARWFFDDSPTGTVSVLSRQTRAEAVRLLVNENQEWSLRAALQLQPTNALALARLASILARSNAVARPTEPPQDWKYLLDFALGLDPANPEVQRLAAALKVTARQPTPNR